MKVKIVDFGFDKGKSLNYIKYIVFGLERSLMEKLARKLEEEIEIQDDRLLITVYYEDKYYPLGSEEAKTRLEDFIAREEIEMTVYLSSILED
ncbi:DUF5750 family protein [Methanothermobacter tenebrarum]|uniref:Uncharacterized protein n=1 Tax=Methanothermobacter tenebrarum TaxID=680118 RepID=A0A328PD55_9EURY|nr:DUF5750 family protein [Methanothermobacter tenebrarum]MBC7100576.1 hypothetical protein [Methanobacteriales archaeon]MBC7118270.1 hypothetical protein [Methanobacteriaceae archaeon]NPV64171.1 hypothetical protein [Methanobacteriaceae archaeon]RAO79790.1 hypothetical protein DPC56_00455 [Methanothermobacter tenebrarum]